MSAITKHYQHVWGLTLCLAAIQSQQVQGAATDLADAPLYTASTANAIKPDIMFMLDDSGSMSWNYVPDYVNDNLCVNTVATSATTGLGVCQYGLPPFMSPDFNKQYYNPEIYYRPPLKPDLTGPYDPQNPTSAQTDVYGVQQTNFQGYSAGTVNLTTQWPDVRWCPSSTFSSATCKSNPSGDFSYPNTAYRYPNSLYSYPRTNSSGSSWSSYTNYVVNGAPYYYRINPSEYCTDSNLTTCIYASAPSGSYTYAARVRWCTDSTLTNCQAKPLPNYPYPRFVGRLTSNANGIITVGTVPNSYTVNSVSVGSTVITSGAVSSGTGGNPSSTLATAIKAAINSKGIYTAYNDATCSDQPTVICIKAARSADFSAVLSVSQSGTGVSVSGMTPWDKTYSFSRVDIVSSRTTYPKGSARIDCTETNTNTCSYAEELKNFANWFSYYRTRMQSMKTGAGLAFQLLDDKYRVGFATINQNSYSSTTGLQLYVDTFDSTQKPAWYAALYAASPNNSTPLRSALKRVGDYYKGVLSGAPDPIPTNANGTQLACQPMYTILTTDGYWNDNFSGIGNQDNSLTDTSGYISRESGTYDGNVSGASDTLADVAMYYYKTDLRPSLANQVARSATDPAIHQHMTTFTLGLGVDGYMKYDPIYGLVGSDLSGDFAKITRGDSGCAWASGVCNWPKPVGDTLSAVDDLWHAAVNGHGRYYSAADPVALRNGIADALNRIGAARGTGAAAATSTPNITQVDRVILSASYNLDPGTDDWSGEVELSVINLDTKDADPHYVWLAQTKLDTLSPASRRVLTFNGNGALPKDFFWSSLTSTEQAYLTNKGGLLTQYALLPASDQANLNSGENILNFIRGDQTYTTSPSQIMRKRQHKLGPIINARPAYVRVPNKNYADAGYGDYKTQQAGRPARAYIAANDGMLHAFDANMTFLTSTDAATGEQTSVPQPTGRELDEKWAYVPRIVMPTLPLLAEQHYGSHQKFTVDGSPVTADAFINGDWHTVLVGGLNKGGRGYYALDVTNPDAPKVLWEFCSDSSLCPGRSDGDLGYTFGNPIVTKNAAGTWVVYFTSGLNNVPGATPGGEGKGYLYQLDLATGALLNKVSTGVGSSATPSGLMKITGWVEAPTTNNTVTFIYGGDQLGNLWRFDVSNASTSIPAPVRMAGLKNPSGSIEPVTVEPTLGYCGGQKMVFLGTGRLLGTSDLGDNSVQTIYAIKDSATNLGDNVRTNNMVQQSVASGSGSPQSRVFTNLPFDASSRNGWYMDLTAQPGEKVTVNPRWLLGHLYIYGNYPLTVDACQPGGTAVLYNIEACTGAAQSTAFNAMVVGSSQYCYGTDCVNQTMQVDKTHIVTPASPGPGGSTGVRVSWREVLE
ncbi:PilC/PilY family type IV pilus protein [Chitinivorax sp. PXF-14]|uniref:pilus assembly protein n=1 Tax=Chitinivorax sp. PXF-14 TaxID=3230488 RepID=UPI0034676558